MIKSKCDLKYYLREDVKNNSFKKINSIVKLLIDNCFYAWGKSNLEFYCNSTQIGILY